MVNVNPEHSSVTSATCMSLIALVVLSLCILQTQSCMPMMPMMMPMMEQAQNAMMFQASNSMFKTLFEDVGQPLFKLHIGGATALVSTVLKQMSPFPFAPENWLDLTIQIGNLLVSTSYALIGLAEGIFRTAIQVAQGNYWDILAGFIRKLYTLRLWLSPTVATTVSPVALSADRQVALLLRDLNVDTGESRSGEETSAQNCLQELMCGLWTSDATSHVWDTFWAMVPVEGEEVVEPPSLPELCETQNEEFSSCYAFIDDFVQTVQTQIDSYRHYYYYNSSSEDYRYYNITIAPWSWAVYG